MILPRPGLAIEWKPWAEKLISELEKVLGVIPIGTQLPVYPKAKLPSAKQPGILVYVSDEVGGAVPAFSDGTNWRRVTDRAVVA